jgi:hypothetical protein
MQKENDGKLRRGTLTHLSRRSDFIESRRITLWFLSALPRWLTAKTLLELGKMQGVLYDAMEYSGSAQSHTSETKTMKELMFISLLSQATSLPQEMVMVMLSSRLSSMKVAGLRGTYWLGEILLDMPALTPSLPRTPIVSPGPDAWQITNIQVLPKEI